MRKLTILLTCFLALTGTSFAWVFLDDVENQSKGKHIQPFFAENIVKSAKIRACVDFVRTSYDTDEDKANEVKKSLAGKDNEGQIIKRRGHEIKKTIINPLTVKSDYYAVSSLISESLFSHISNLSSSIKSSGRENEFYDIFKFISGVKKPADLIYFKNSPSSPDKAKRCDAYGWDNKDIDLRLTFEINDEFSSLVTSASGTAASADRHSIEVYYIPECVNAQGDCLSHIYENEKHRDKLNHNPDLRFKLQKYDLRRTITHELGHSLGLGDQYHGATEALLSSVYTLQNLEDLTSINSIMNMSPNLTCDDAEGLINLIDFYNKASDSKRIVYGWASICPGRNLMYYKGVAVKLSPWEYQQQVKFAASGYEGEEPSHLQRVRAEADKVLNKNALAMADYFRKQQEKEDKSKQFIDNVPVCPVCGEKAFERVVIDPPKIKRTQGQKIWSEPNPDYLCPLELHPDCWKKFKEESWNNKNSQERKNAWNDLCRKSKK